MKKLYLASSALATVAFVSAASAHSFEGPHAGVSLGVSNNMMDKKLSPEDTAMAGFTGKATLGKMGFTGGVTVGFNKFFNEKFFGGVEAFAYMNSGKNESNLVARDAAGDVVLTKKGTFQRKHGFGVDAKLGTLLGSSLVYGRLGVDFGTFEKSIKISDSPDTANNGQQTKKKRKMGFRAGVGTETKVTDKISVGMDYIYTHYGNLGKKKSNQEAFEVKGTKASDHKVLFSMKYYFKG